MKTSTSSKRSFAKGMLIYAIIFLCLTVILWVVFWLWTSSYENSRPISCLKNYIENINEDYVRELSSDVLSEVNSSLQSEDEAVLQLTSMIKGASLSKDVTTSTETRQIYYLSDNGNYISTITLSAGEEGMFGHVSWSVSEQTLLKENLLSSFSVVIPDSYSLEYNGERLSPVSSDTEYQLLSGFYEELPSMPHLATYSVGNVIGPLNVDIFDENGNKISDDCLNEEFYQDNCSISEKEEILNYAKIFIDKYVQYTSLGVAYGTGYYYDLLSVIVHYSTLYCQIRDSVQGFGYASSQGDAVLDVRVPECMKVGDNDYVCKVEYDIETYGNHGKVTDQTFTIRLLMTNVSGTYQSSAILFY